MPSDNDEVVPLLRDAMLSDAFVPPPRKRVRDLAFDRFHETHTCEYHDIEQTSEDDGDESSDIGENTPPRGQRTMLSLFSRLLTSRAMLVVTTISVAYIVFFAISLQVRNTLPEPFSPTSSDGDKLHFIAENTLPHLQTITSRFHPWNSVSNTLTTHFILSQILSLRNAFPHRSINITIDDIAFSNISHVHLTPIALMTPAFTRFLNPHERKFIIYHSKNIAVRIPGSYIHNASILVASHFDSVPTSYGAFDDGIGVVVMLEVMRVLLLSKPLERDVVFLFGSGEELGLLDAKAFTKHEFFKDVVEFINIEAGGVGRRAMLFRASSMDLVQTYSRIAPHPHLNVIANDVFNLNIIPSDTDFRIFSTENNVPGIDVAFYEGRNYYHTALDNFTAARAQLGSIQHVGDNILALVLSRGNETTWDDEKRSHLDFGIYYDVLGRNTVSYSFDSYLIWNLAVLLGTITLLLFQGAFLYYIIYERRIQLTTDVLAPVFRSFGFIILSALVGDCFAIALAYIIHLYNPIVLNAAPWLVFTLLSFSIIFGITLMQWTWFYLENRNADASILFTTADNIEQASNYALILFWWVLLIGTTIAGGYGYGSLYLIAWWSLMSFISVLIPVVIEVIVMTHAGIGDYYSSPTSPSTMSRRVSVWRRVRDRVLVRPEKYLWALRFLVATSWPAILTIDVTEMALNALTPTVLDGVPSVAISTILSVFAMLLYVPLVPIIQRIGKFKVLSVVFFIMVVVTLTLCLGTWPHGAEKPAKFYFEQVQSTVNQSSIVKIRGVRDTETLVNGLNEKWKVASNANWDCHRVQLKNGPIVQDCEVEITNRDFYLMVGDENLPRLEMKHAEGKVTGFMVGPIESMICEMNATVPSESPLTQNMTIWLGDPTFNVSSNVSVTMTFFRPSLHWTPENTTVMLSDDYNSWIVPFEITNVTSSLMLTASCYIDDMNFIPMYQLLFDNLPPWSTFTSKMYGISRIYQTYSI